MSELREFLENQKERLKIIKLWCHRSIALKEIRGLCDESIADINRYLERHKPPVEEYEHFRKKDTP